MLAGERWERVERSVGSEELWNRVMQAPEAIAAREAGAEVFGLSLVTNHAAGVTDAPLDHAEVIAAGKQAAPRLASLLADITAAI